MCTHGVATQKNTDEIARQSSPSSAAETHDATVMPDTPPQIASTLTRDVTSSSFADLKQLVAARGAPFSGRVRVTPKDSSSEKPEPSQRGSPMKRAASTPSFPTHTSIPAPGSQGMRDMFFVRQDNVNFNASYGTPVREVRPWTTRSTPPAPCANCESKGKETALLSKRAWVSLF
jgi:hypothetical protein